MIRDLIASGAKKRVWMYNIGADKDWAPENLGMRKVHNPHEQRILNRQAELLMFLTKEADTLYLIEPPDEEFVQDMVSFGMVRPRIRLLAETGTHPENFTWLAEGSGALLAELEEPGTCEGEVVYIPYVVTERDEEICKKIHMQLWGAPSSIARKINSKVFARQIAKELGFQTTEGCICSSPEELASGYADLQTCGYVHCVIKEPYGSSGKGVHFVKDEKMFKNLSRMIRFSSEPGVFQVLLEGWIEDKRDINYQILITPEGAVELLVINEQLIKQTAYKGTRFPAGLTWEQEAIFRDAAEKIGKRLYQEGYLGVVGIDAIVRGSGEVIPVIEFNGRFNQSTFYTPLVTRLYDWGRQAVIKYYDIRTRQPLKYRKLKEYLARHGAAFEEETRTGILVLNSACLSYHYDAKTDSYLSRVFLAMVKEAGAAPNALVETADNLMEEIQSIQ